MKRSRRAFALTTCTLAFAACGDLDPSDAIDAPSVDQTAAALAVSDPTPGGFDPQPPGPGGALPGFDPCRAARGRVGRANDAACEACGSFDDVFDDAFIADDSGWDDDGPSQLDWSCHEAYSALGNAVQGCVDVCAFAADCNPSGC